MAVKCFLIFFMLWIRSSFNCFNTFFSIFFFLLPVSMVVGGVLLRRREALTLRHSLLQKLQLKYTRSLVDRFKIPLDISIVDNTSDGLVSILFLA